MKLSIVKNIVIDIKSVLERKKEIWIVVSGGKSPIDLFKSLSKQDIDWSRVNITLADERWVPVDDDRSNEGLVRRYLIKNKASDINFFGLMANKDISIIHELYYKDFLANIDEIDILILGMGLDGHTASYFSIDKNLTNILDINNKNLISKVSLPHEPFDRVTLNFNILSTSKKIYLPIIGEEKKLKFIDIVGERNILNGPISIFLEHSIDIYCCA